MSLPKITDRHDQILNLIAGADTPISASDIGSQLGINYMGKLRSMLRDMVQDEEIERANGGGYVVRGIVKHEFPTTDRAAVDKREKNNVSPHEFSSNAKTKIACIEDAEQAADKDKGVSAALYRLEAKLQADPVSIQPLKNVNMKAAMLYKLSLIMEQSIATECHELLEWMQAVFKLGKDRERES